MPKKQSDKTEQPEQYKVILKLNNEELEASHEILTEALGGIKPTAYKTKGILQVSYGKLKGQKILTIQQMKRLFSSEIARIVTAKQLNFFLK